MVKKELARQVEIARELKRRERFNRLDYYDPYPYQVAFHETGADASQRLLMAANRIGKSYCGAFELAAHVTGLYPDWWKGKRYSGPITAWACGVSSETTRDIIQFELLGSPDDPEQYGTGTLPLHLIVKTERKPGIPNAKSVILVKHIAGGNSTIHLKSYAMGVEIFQGKSVDCCWLDEEPSRDIYSQCVTRTLDRRGMVYLTFTPERGMTETVASFLNDLKPGQSINNATWDDATEKVRSLHNKPGHLNEEVMEQILSSYAPAEREMRRNGRPAVGSGLVYPVAEDKIICDPFPIPNFFVRLAAIDFGWDHPTAAVWVAWDRDKDIVYIYDCYRQRKAPPQVHATEIRKRGDWINVVWPHDGNRKDSMGNPGLAEQYRNFGVNMMPFHFENPPALGEKKGGNSVEVGIMDLLQRMEDGRLFVFSTLTDWFAEWRMYHRKDGKVVPLHDDLMSSTRYAVMSLRYATGGTDSTWTEDIQYRNLGIV